jgi:hypothetical protein
MEEGPRAEMEQSSDALAVFLRSFAPEMEVVEDPEQERHCERTQHQQEYLSCGM